MSILKQSGGRRRVRQGQSRWQVVLYEPGKLAGYPPDSYVAAVYQCFVTESKGGFVYYDAGAHPYMCSARWFLSLPPTYRKAKAHANSKTALINAEIARVIASRPAPATLEQKEPGGEPGP